MLDADAVARAEAALRREHAADPRPAREGDGRTESEAHHEAVVRWLERLWPDPSPHLRLAAWAQHLRRYEIPREDYPAGRTGYLTWRTAAARHQAEAARAVLRAAGIPPADADRVADLVRKKGLGRDAEAQALEDAACLAFLEREAADFAAGRDRGDVVRILAKTLRKMSPKARALALADHAAIPEAVRALVGEAAAGLRSEP